jgi:hypothetical protein
VQELVNLLFLFVSTRFSQIMSTPPFFSSKSCQTFTKPLPVVHPKSLQTPGYTVPSPPFRSGIFKLQPSEQLHLNRSATWEAAVEEMWQKVLVPMGFKLEAPGTWWIFSHCHGKKNHRFWIAPTFLRESKYGADEGSIS